MKKKKNETFVKYNGMEKSIFHRWKREEVLILIYKKGGKLSNGGR